MKRQNLKYTKKHRAYAIGQESVRVEDECTGVECTLPANYEEASDWVKEAINELEKHCAMEDGFLYIGWYNGINTDKGMVIDCEFNRLSRKFRFGIRSGKHPDGTRRTLYYSKREF